MSLYSGMLDQAINWLAQRYDDLSPTELAYIEAIARTGSTSGEVTLQS